LTSEVSKAVHTLLLASLKGAPYLTDEVSEVGPLTAILAIILALVSSSKLLSWSRLTDCVKGPPSLSGDVLQGFIFLIRDIIDREIDVNCHLKDMYAKFSRAV